MTLSEHDFRLKSDESIERARRALLPLADTEGFEVEPLPRLLERLARTFLAHA